MLHHRPLDADPAGTRPWMLGSGLELESHCARGAASNEGDAAVTTGAWSGVSPPPCPSASRSLGGPKGDCAAAGEASASSASSITRAEHRAIRATIVTEGGKCLNRRA